MILIRFLKHIGNDESGATAVEYGLIVSLAVIALLGSLQALGAGSEGLWGRVMEASNEAMGN